MNGTKRILGIASAIGLLLTQSALADSISFNGTVVGANAQPVYAGIGGTVDSVGVEVGSMVQAGDTLAQLKTTKVYATEDGTVTGIFGTPGDSVETLQNRYGAVLYVESASRYTIAASTDNAYNSTATKFVHTGESVYLSCYTDSGSHTGTGLITAVSGTDFTVEVTDGSFVVGETVSVYRDSGYASSARIGRGTLNRMNPTAYNGTGSLVSLAVSEGDSVARGDLLYETIDGSYSAYYMSGTGFTAPIDGCVAELNVSAGSTVDSNGVVALIYPEDDMRISATVYESDLAYIHEGDQVTIELSWNQDEDVQYTGTIAMISAVSDSSSSGSSGTSGAAVDTASTSGDSEEVSYTVYIDFTPDADTRYGMSAVITTLDAADTADDQPEAAASDTEGD